LQISSEIDGIFDFLNSVYGICGFSFKIKLSTRPEKYIGELSSWDEAEAKLKTALDKFTTSVGSSWEEKPGDGAFYGPKIDIELMDALQREHQCGTIQLDFNLPRRFKLRYVTKESTQLNPVDNAGEDDLPAGYARPVMIHRAIFGSFERMFGVLTEHFGGKWPFWLSPRQVQVIPVMPALSGYAEEVRDLFRDYGLYVDADLSGNTLQKKIRSAQLEQYNFIFGETHRPWGAYYCTCTNHPHEQLLVRRKKSPARSTSVTVMTLQRTPRAGSSPSTRLPSSWFA
jgi:threonyl-tRNA synthetase